MADGGEQERGFTIVDKRGSEEEPAQGPGQASEPGGQGAAPGGAPDPGPESLPPADLMSLLLSLGTSALYHLGEVDDPQAGGRAEVNLPLARHAIGTLEVLQAKTEGNRTEEESGLLTNLLTDLRMRFVQASKARSG